MSIVQKLTEGIVNRDLSTEGAALVTKWESTGLLEGIGDDTARNGMARLLENQAKELLRESSSMSGGDVEGFAAVAFPLVRRVFGNLIANDLVSVQPMSLPSGLIFFLDFTYGGVYEQSAQNTEPRLGYITGKSVYGGDVVGAEITGGVDLAGLAGTDAGGAYNLRNGYSSPTGSVTATSHKVVISGSINGNGSVDLNTSAGPWVGRLMPFGQANEILRFDPDLVSGSAFAILEIDPPASDQLNYDDLAAISLGSANAAALTLVHRLSVLSASSDGTVKSNSAIHLVCVGNTTSTVLSGAAEGATLSIPETDNFRAVGTAMGAIEGTTNWALEGNDAIPEIDIKVDSVAVTAVTKKLKAKWTPELGQDLNAYHNLDAEVELTQILSEQIALEIDREILEDLVKGATAGTRYWSRHPGQFLNRETGAVSSVTQDFTGNVSEWYETLVETINDVSAQIHRKTLRGAANFCVISPEIANILEFTAGFRANVTADSDRGDAGAVKVGSLSKKFDLIVDPYFPRNLILVGRRGSSFLESGYVYAPYVPLQTTPTIFGVEDFVPRKGVMTRYAKKMVRPDMYGLVIVRGLEA
tara:strand:- start:6008 stop:7765 length:1758 start_codon:yes stop_codon:yes gene_type:complete